MSEIQPNERFSRQRDIVPPERIADCKATVIGVGAIGRQVALQLSAMGIPWLQLVDHDKVEWSNLASQGYLEGDMGKLKVNLPTRKPVVASGNRLSEPVFQGSEGDLR